MWLNGSRFRSLCQPFRSNRDRLFLPRLLLIHINTQAASKDQPGKHPPPDKPAAAFPVQILIKLHLHSFPGLFLKRGFSMCSSLPDLMVNMVSLLFVHTNSSLIVVS